MKAAYEERLECRKSFGGTEVFFRPMKPSDEERLKELFYSQSAETTRLRYGIPLKTLSPKQLHDLVCVDFRDSMAIAGFVRERGRERMICVGRYCGQAGDPAAEAAFTVHDDYQNRGIGTFLINFLAGIALERGVTAFTAEVSPGNIRILRAFRSCFDRMEETDLGPDGVVLSLPLSGWRGREPDTGRSVADLKTTEAHKGAMS
jgi:GNAT superfamily N-acetyltransferase